MINKTIIMSVLVISFAFGTTLLKADEFDLNLDDELVNLFASKRKASTQVPKQNRTGFIKALPSNYVAGELNMVVFDAAQSGLIPVSNKMKVKAKSEYSVNFKSYKGNFYAYIYQVSPKGNVIKLFPSGKRFKRKNPVFELFEYRLPSDKKTWTKFSSQKGWNLFYFFLSTKPISEIKPSMSVNELEQLLAKNMRQERIYLSQVKNKTEFNKKNFIGKVYSSMLGFKNRYSEKIAIWNNG